MMSNPYIGERRVVTGVPRAIGACEEGLRRDPTARCAERAATTTRDHKQTRGMTKLIRFCRKVDDNILLSTSSSIFDVLSFQYVVWFVNFATEPDFPGAAVRAIPFPCVFGEGGTDGKYPAALRSGHFCYRGEW